MLIIITNCQNDMKEANLYYPDGKIFNNLGEYFRIGSTLAIMMCLDWWVWELQILVSGLLGVEDQATTIIIMNIILIGYMFATGLESASCTLIGNQIGSLNLTGAY